MRLLFAALPAFGHVFPLMPLSLAARDAGHDVMFATGADFVSRLSAWGFETRKAGESLDWAFAQTAAKYPELLEKEQPGFGAALFVESLGPGTLADLDPLLAEVRPDVVVYEATDLGAPVAAGRHGIPAVCHAVSTWRDAFRDALAERMPLLWEQAGTEPSLDATTGDLFLDIWPPSMQSPSARQIPKVHRVLRPIPWSDPSSPLPDWVIDARGPLVFVSLGTVFWGKELLRKVIDGLSTLDVDALVLAGVDATPEELPVSSERIHVTGFVDQPAVLRHADVVVHHGGAGTLLGSLFNGLPQVVLPQGADRPYTAASLVESGAGVRVEPGSATPESVAAAVVSVLEDPTYRVNASRLRDEIAAMPPPEAVVSHIEGLVRP